MWLAARLSGLGVVIAAVLVLVIATALWAFGAWCSDLVERARRRDL